MTELRNTWALREVYFDEHGNPSMHREPVPMTDEQLDAVMRKALGYGLSPSRDDLEFARAVAAHHGITAQAKKETP